jgi:hypothetical protein
MKGHDFVWDGTANKAFEALKLALTRTPLLFPPIIVEIISYTWLLQTLP